MTEPQNGSRPLDKLAQRLIKEYWEFYPTAGSHIGRHEYDGRLPYFTQATLSRRAQSVRHGLSEV